MRLFCVKMQQHDWFRMGHSDWLLGWGRFGPFGVMWSDCGQVLVTWLRQWWLSCAKNRNPLCVGGSIFGDIKWQNNIKDFALSHPFCSMSIGPPIPDIQHFENLTLKIHGQGQMSMILHNYRSRQFHRTSNGINPYSGFRDMGSAKSGPSAARFDKFLAHGQAYMGQMGK